MSTRIFPIRQRCPDPPRRASRPTRTICTAPVVATADKGVTTYTPISLSDGDDITQMKDASGEQANCFYGFNVDRIPRLIAADPG